jgi:RNA polymerase sigma factor (sigma-70 family)
MWSILGAYVILFFMTVVAQLVLFVASAVLAPEAAAVIQGFTTLDALDNPDAAFRTPGYILLSLLRASRVTHNLAIDHVRREARMRKLHHAAAAEPLPPPGPSGPQSMTPALERELQRLAVHERAVIVLKVIEGRSYKEISALTGLSTSNVGYLIHHGLKKLAARLDAAGVAEGGGR